MEGHQHSSTGVTLQRTQSLFLNVNKSTILLVFIQKKKWLTSVLWLLSELAVNQFGKGR